MCILLWCTVCERPWFQWVTLGDYVCGMSNLYIRIHTCTEIYTIVVNLTQTFSHFKVSLSQYPACQWMGQCAHLRLLPITARSSTVSARYVVPTGCQVCLPHAGQTCAQPHCYLPFSKSWNVDLETMCNILVASSNLHTPFADTCK